MKKLLTFLLWIIVFGWVFAMQRANFSLLDISAKRILFTDTWYPTGEKVMDINSWWNIVVYWPLVDSWNNEFVTADKVVETDPLFMANSWDFYLASNPSNFIGWGWLSYTWWTLFLSWTSYFTWDMFIEKVWIRRSVFESWAISIWWTSWERWHVISPNTLQDVFIYDWWTKVLVNRYTHIAWNTNPLIYQVSPTTWMRYRMSLVVTARTAWSYDYSYWWESRFWLTWNSNLFFFASTTWYLTIIPTSDFNWTIGIVIYDYPTLTDPIFVYRWIWQQVSMPSFAIRLPWYDSIYIWKDAWKYSSSTPTNIWIWTYALEKHFWWTSNLAIWHSALRNDIDWVSNIAIWSFSLFSNVNSRDLIWIWSSAFYFLTGWNRNIWIWWYSFRELLSWSDLINIWYQGWNFLANWTTKLTWWNNLIYIGNSIRALVQNEQNSITIWNNVTSKWSNTVSIWDDNIEKTFLKWNIQLGSWIITNATYAFIWWLNSSLTNWNYWFIYWQNNSSSWHFNPTILWWTQHKMYDWFYSAIIGWQYSSMTGYSSAMIWWFSNKVDWQYSVIIWWQQNIINTNRWYVLGWYKNYVYWENSIVFGSWWTASWLNSFVYSDWVWERFETEWDYSFAIKAQGWVLINRTTQTTGIALDVSWAIQSSSWLYLSDKRRFVLSWDDLSVQYFDWATWEEKHSFTP